MKFSMTSVGLLAINYWVPCVTTNNQAAIKLLKQLERCVWEKFVMC